MRGKRPNHFATETNVKKATRSFHNEQRGCHF
nr:MAG TPA: hypothetical protein [Caudoviricetes sp.]